MSLPTIFANLTAATGAELDGNFQAVGVMGVFSCTVSGTNTITFTTASNQPTLSAYANYLAFRGVVAVTNTGSVTINVNGLGALNGYKDASGGPTALASGDLHAGNLITAVYDSALNTGSGGFHIKSGTV